MSTVSRLLVVDAGHTRIKLALVAASGTDQLPEVVSYQAVMITEPIPWERLLPSPVHDRGELKSVIAGSNPQAVQQVRDQWPSTLAFPEILTGNANIPLPTDVDHPERVGVDRLLNALSANRLRQEGQAAIIVDTGTAITVDCLSSKGVFLGGVILPGVRMAARALNNYTATLPLIETGMLFGRTPPAIGRNTSAAIESGLYWGHVGAVRELILRIRDQLATLDRAKDAPPLLLMTGGAAELLRPHFRHARFEPHLALQGLALAAFAFGDTTAS